MIQSQPTPTSAAESGPFATLEKLLTPGAFITLFVTRTQAGLSMVLHGALGDTQPLEEPGADFDAQLPAVFEQLGTKAPPPAASLLEQLRPAPTVPPPSKTAPAVTGVNPKVSPPAPPAVTQEVLSTPRHTPTAVITPAQQPLDLDDLDV